MTINLMLILLWIVLINKLINLPTPFNDKRFSVEPIYTDSNKQGLNHSEWSTLREGGYLKSFDKDKKKR